MGAGNPKLKSFDNDKFEPTTYFIDLSAYITNEDNDDADEDEYEIDGYAMELMYDDLIESFCAELGMTALESNRDNLYPELSYAFREEGIVILEGDNALIITETGAEYSSLPLAVIPSFKFEDILDEVCYEHQDKEEWYDARGKDFRAAMEVRAEKIWDKKMNEFHKEESEIIGKLKAWYSKGLYCRNGAWLWSKVA
jgi:hypothetical protein